MAINETYFYGQGKLYSRLKGVSGAWRWWGDVSALTFGGTDEKVSHKESYSGQKASVRSFSIGGDRTLSGTIHQIDVDSLAELLRGDVSTIAGGSVSAELLPADLVAGDVVKLDKPYNVSDLVIVDSTGTPVTLDPENYDLEAPFGSIQMLTIPGGAMQPFKAAYEYLGGRQVSFFSRTPKDIELRYEGINLAEGGAPIIAEFYRVSSAPLQQLALITSGNDVAGTEFSAEALLDSSKPVSGPLGRFGRYVQITEA